MQSCGPSSAAIAAFCTIDAGFEVDWLCSLLSCAITGAGPSAWLDRALQGRLGGSRNPSDLDPRTLELRLGDDHAVCLEGERLDSDARALGGEHAVPVRIAQVDAVDAEVQEPADVDGPDTQVALDGVARFVGDIAPQVLGTPPGVQPD